MGCIHRVGNSWNIYSELLHYKAAILQVKSNHHKYYNSPVLSCFQDCPEGTPDFRESQCKAFDNRAYMGKVYSWESFVDGKERNPVNFPHAQIAQPKRPFPAADINLSFTDFYMNSIQHFAAPLLLVPIVNLLNVRFSKCVETSVIFFFVPYQIYLLIVQTVLLTKSCSISLICHSEWFVRKHFHVPIIQKRFFNL